MTMIRKCLYSAAIAALFAVTIRADVVTQGFEGFSTTTPPTAPGTQTVNDWTINDLHIMSGFGPVSPHGGSKMAFFPDAANSGISSPTNSFVRSPVLSNGVGTVSFYLNNVTFIGGTGPFSCDLQVKTNGTWNTVATINNTGKSGWVGYTNTLNIYEGVQLRLFRNSVGVSPTSWLGIDDISTTEAPAKVTISDIQISPAQPEAGDGVAASAVVTPSSLAVVTNVSLLWSANGGASNTINMSYNEGNGRYETDSLITNQPAFTVIGYTVRVDFSGPTPLSPNTESGSFFFRQPPPTSAYSNVTVKGDLTQTLDLVEDGYWADVKAVGALGQTDLYFETVDGTTNRWSDPDPLRTNLPVFGAFATNVVDDIRIAGSDAGWLLMSFDENSGRFGIQQTDYQSFNTWSGATSYGNHNVESWTLTRGRTTTDSSLAFDSYSVQFQSTTSERAIASPELPNGIGTISFRYRNTETNGLSPATFAIQVRTTNTVPWSTVETVSDIIAPDYLYHSFTVASLDQRYIRIVALSGTATAQLLIDDIIITRPGATVTFSGLTHTPTNPTVTNTVDVDVDITALNGAALNTVTLWFRGFDHDTTYGLPITFNNLDGHGTLTDFPALIKLTTANTTGYAGFLDTANGYDLRFWSGNALTGNELDYEIEDFDSSGTSTIWVKIPSLTQGTSIWATWGNTNYNYQASCTTNGSVWSEDFGGVWHMSEKDAVDATGNGNNGTAVGGTTTVANGIVGAGNEFDGDLTFDKIDFSAHGLKLQQNRSFSIWLKSDILLGTRGNSRDPGIISGISGGNTYHYISFNTGNRITMEDSTDGGTELDVPMGSVFATDTWYHLVVMIESDNKASAYWNGQYCGKDADAFVDLSLSYLGLGYGFASTAFYYGAFDGIFDEMRFSTVARSSDWVWASYMTIGSHTDFTSYGTAAELNASSIYDPIPMTNTTGDHYTGTIPRGDIGLMQYYIEASYLNPATGGYQSNNEPLGVTGMPASYTNTDVVAGLQGFEDFAVTSLPSPPGSQTVNDWTINDLHIRPSLGPVVPHGGSRLAFFPDSANSGIPSPTNCYVQSPVLSNGIGTVSFYLNNVTFGGGAGPFICELQVRTNGIWNTVATIDNTGNSGWVGYTNTLNIYDSVELRLFRNAVGASSFSWIGVDDISMTYPPAYVTASDFEEHPAYPSQEETTAIACTIESATTYHPAFNISGILTYRVNDQVNGWTGWNSAGMTRIGSRFYGEIPAQLNLSEVEYYVEAGFNGYSAVGESLSPMTFPEEPLEYSVRRYISAYSNVSIRIGDEDVANLTQLDNQTWEGIVLFVDPTNQPAFEIGGYGYYDGTNVTNGLTFEWGDDDVFSTNMPLAGTASIGGLPIVIPELAEGQYLITFNEVTGDYSVQRVVYQDFENWPADSELFGESYAAARITEHEQNFSTWPLSNLDIISADFEEGGWPPSDDYPDTWVINSGTSTEGTNVTYKIQGGIIVTQRVGQAALLGPGVQGHVRNIALRKDDAGQFSFDLRCASPNDFRPAVLPAVTNVNMRIQARIRATDMPTNSTLDSFGFCYKSIIGNYIDENNYYEARVVQHELDRTRYEIWKINGGVPTRLDTWTGENGRLDSDETLMMYFYRTTPGSNTVKIRFQWRGNKQRTITDSSALPVAYDFGFNGLDASLSVEDVRVYAVTNSNFAIDGDAAYEQIIDGGPLAGWDNSSGAWSFSTDHYHRNGYTRSALTAKMQFSENAVDWDDVATFTNLTHSYYKRYTGYPHTATSGYVRVLFDGGNSGEYMLIDNVERQAWVGEAVTTTNNWQGTNLWVDTTGNDGRGAEMRNSRAAGNADQWILSPPLTGGASVVSFDYKTADGATDPVAFDIYYTRSDVGPDTWYRSTSYTNSIGATNWISYSHSIDDRSLAIKISRIRLRNQTPGQDIGLLIDNLNITEPPPINDTTWWGYNALITDQQPDGIFVDDENPWLLRQSGNQFGAFLNNSSTNDTGEGVTNDLYYPFIRSAYLSGGIGDIRFHYRAWDTNVAQIQIVGTTTNQQAVDAEWDVLLTVPVTDTSYNEYSANLFERDYHYLGLRVFSKNGSLGRVGIDNILITGPVSADIQLRDLRLDPAIPTDDDLVFVEVDVGDPFYNPQNVKIWMHYITGTNSWGTYTNGSPQQLVVNGTSGDYTVYRTLSPIPKQDIDDVVQFRVEATFEGLNADKASPKAYRSFTAPVHYWPIDLNRNQANQTPYYIVFSGLPGQVWINELNIADAVDFTPTYDKQYVELVGVGNVNIGNWRIESINTGYSTNAVYTINPGTTFGGTANEYGFYVLGNTNTITPPPDIPLTNTLPNGGGIQLIRGVWNIIEDQVSYDVGAEGGGKTMSLDTNRKYAYAGVDQILFSSYPLSLVDDGGPGSNKTDFVWSQTTGDFSHIGTTNISQTLIPWPTNGPPVEPDEYTGTASIGTASYGGGVVYFDISTQATNLVPSVWYVTNLLNVTSNDWQRRTQGFGYSRSNTTYNIWCDAVPPPAFYSIKVNREP